MDLLRQNLQTELGQKGFQISLPEDKDARFPAFPADSAGAARIAREGKLSGMVFVTEIWRWEGETQKFVRALVDFKLMRIDDGAIVWERRAATRHSYTERDESRSGIDGCDKSNRARSVRGMKRGCHVGYLDL